MNKIIYLASTVALAQAVCDLENDPITKVSTADITIPWGGNVDKTSYGLLAKDGCTLVDCQVTYEKDDTMSVFTNGDKDLFVTPASNGATFNFKGKEGAKEAGWTYNLHTKCSVESIDDSGNVTGTKDLTSDAFSVTQSKKPPTVCTIQKNAAEGDFGIVSDLLSSKVSVSKSHWGLELAETNCAFTSCEVVFTGASDGADTWFSTTNSNTDESIEYSAKNDKANHAKFVSGVKTKCTDELGGELTSDPYSVTYAHCEDDDALTKKVGFQFDSTPEPWRTPREWGVISKSSSLQTVDMFTHNQYCPITSCFLYSGWKAATPVVAAQDAVIASEGVEAKDAVEAQPATEATPCDKNGFLTKYKLVAGDDTIDGSKTYNLQTNPDSSGLNSNLCIQCNGNRGAEATQQFTFVQMTEAATKAAAAESDSSDDEDDIVDPAAEGDNTVLILSWVILALVLCCATCCYYGHFVAGKPKTETIEITAVDGNLDGKAIDVEAAGGVKAGAGVKAKGEFQSIPLDSARTDASGQADVKVEASVDIKTNAV